MSEFINFQQAASPITSQSGNIGGGAPNSDGLGGQSTTSTPSTPSAVQTAGAGPAVSSRSATATPNQSAVINTSTATLSPTHAASTGNNSNSVSTGALAGGIVGAFLGGALIAFLMAFLFMSRRRKGDGKVHGSAIAKDDEPNRRRTGDEKSGAPLVDPKHAWELHLPQPADDVTLRQAVKTLYDRLELHVENFYSNSSSTASRSVDEGKWNTAISQIETPFLPASLQDILQQGRAKTTVMKHCIAYLTISGIDVNAQSAFPLLPTELVTIPQAATRAGQNKTVLTQALARHAQLSNYLLSPISTTLPRYASERDAIIASAVGAICTAFAPWANNSASIQVRMENLTQILREASDTGIMLCGQPEQFFWNWKLTRRESRKIVIVPAFIKLKLEDSSSSALRQAKDVELVPGRVGDI